MEYIAKNIEETYTIAKNVAKKLCGGDILALKGDLGSGKTTFTKGIGVALGLKKDITSPTFVISKTYQIDHPTINQLVHIDSYRLETLDDADSIGLMEIIERKDTLLVIEWPGKVWPLISKRAKLIEFEYLSENERKINITF